MSKYLRDKELIDSKAKVFKALSHPSRLFMVEELSKGEKCVCEFVDEIKADFSTISKHLSILKEAGIIKSEKRGKWVYYHLSLTCVTGFVVCLGESLIENVEMKAELFNKN